MARIGHRRLSASRLAIMVTVALVAPLAACGGDSSTSDASKAGNKATTTLEESTSSTDTTEATVTDTDETTTTLGSSGTTLPGGTPTTAKIAKGTTTTVKRSGATTTTVRRSGVTTTTIKPRVTAQPASKGTIKLGGLYSSVTAAGAATLKESFKIGNVWVDEVNAAGGINGYKVSITWRDAKSDSARGLQAVKELADAGVVAIVGNDAANVITGNTDRLLIDKQLPILGGGSFSPQYDDHPMYFPVSAGFTAGVYGQVAAARDSGAKKMRTIYCTEVPSCAASNAPRVAAARREGIQYSSQAASASASDYTANCLSAKNDGIDFLQLNGVSAANAVRDCVRQNYHPIFAVGGQANQSVIDATRGEQVAGNLFEFGIFYEGPEAQRYRAALAKTDVRQDQVTQVSIETWLGFEMAGAVIQRITAADPTRSDFLSAVYTVQGENLDGQIAPVDYTVQRPGSGLHAANDCWTEHLVKDGRFFHMDKNGQIVHRLTFICGTGKTYTLGSY